MRISNFIKSNSITIGIISALGFSITTMLITISKILTNPSYSIESTVMLYPEFIDGSILNKVFTQCKTYDDLLEMRRPEILGRTYNPLTNTDSGIVTYNTTNTTRIQVDAACKIYQKRWSYDRKTKQWSFNSSINTDDIPMNDWTQSTFCGSTDMRLSLVSNGKVMGSVLANIDYNSSCTNQHEELIFSEFFLDVEDPYMLVPLSPYPIGISHSLVSSMCTENGIIYYWYVDDMATSKTKNENFVVTNCGKPGNSNNVFIIAAMNSNSSVVKYVKYNIPATAPIPVYDTYHQVSIIPKEGSVYYFIYPGRTSTGEGHLAYTIVDLSTGTTIDQGGFLGGVGNIHEVYPLGVVSYDGYIAIAYIWSSNSNRFTNCNDGNNQCNMMGAGNLSVRIYDINNFTENPVADITVEFDDKQSEISQDLLTSATHPDITYSEGYLYLSYSLYHYRKTGCGEDKLQPCRYNKVGDPTSNNIKITTANLAAIRVE